MWCTAQNQKTSDLHENMNSLHALWLRTATVSDVPCVYVWGGGGGVVYITESKDLGFARKYEQLALCKRDPSILKNYVYITTYTIMSTKN